MLRFLSFVGLALWIGGLTALGAIVAPAAFGVLGAHDPAAGSVLAGTLFGDILRSFDHWLWAIGALLLVLLLIRAALGPRPRRTAVQASVIVGMLAATSYSALVIAPRIDVIRADVAGPIAALSDTDARKITFGRLHGLSTALAGLMLAGGLVVLWLEARDA